MADVADGAGLSRGIVNFHFESKEKLLVATLQYMADEYSAHWRAALQKAGDDPARQLASAGRCRFRPLDLQQAQARRLVRLLGRGEIAADLSGAVRRARRGLPERLHRHLPQAEGRRRLRFRAARQRRWRLSAMLEGLWLRLMMGTEDVTRESAHHAALRLSWRRYFRNTSRGKRLPTNENRMKG